MRNYGPIYNLGMHQRGWVWWNWVAQCIQRYTTVRLSSSNPGGINNAYVKIHMYKDQINAISDAFWDVGNGATSYSFPPHPNALFSLWYEDSYKHSYTAARELVKKARIREQQIVGLCLALMTHANNLGRYRDKFVKYVRTGDGTKTKALAIKALRENKIYKKSVKLLTKEKVSQMYADYLTSFKSAAGAPLYSYDDTYNLTSLKLMYKILSQRGYGLLEGRGKELRGNKTILHVGVTNSMVATMRLDAYKETGDRRYLNSSKICINVYKKNQLNSYELLYPKAYIFDMSAHILDIDQNGDYLSHIADFNETWNLDDIVKNTSVTRWTDQGNNNPGLETDAYTDDFRAVIGKDLIAKGINDKDVFINHLFDYSFKLYYRLTLGIDIKESTYLLGKNIIDHDSVSATRSVGQGALQAQYDSLEAKIIEMYPAANLDPLLSSEMFRVLNVIKASSLYSGLNKIKKVFNPKMFDRVFAVLVNEKDFIVHKDSLSKNWLDIYQSEPSFEYTSKLYRPDVVDDFSGDASSSTQINDVTTVTKKYKASCFNNYPEVYTYYVNISLLPDDAY